MAVSIKIDSFARDISVILREDLSPEAMSRHIAETARVAITEVDQINARALGGMAPPRKTSVDGREGAALESVSPSGVIQTEWDLVESMLEWIGTALVVASPVLTGRFAASHAIVVDGVALETSTSGTGSVIPPLPPGWQEIVFVNIQPYARKIERGLSDQAPNGVYEGVAALASRRFGNVARIRFGYRTPLFGAIDTWANTPGAAAWARAHGRRKDPAEWLRRQPAVVISAYG